MNRDEQRVSGHPNDNDGASDTDDPGQPGVASQGKDRLVAVRGNDRRRRESAVIDEKVAVLSREKLVTAREDAAHLRETEASSREQEIRAAETIHAAPDNHMFMLQQANAHLVIAAIEAQKLAEQVQAAKDQLNHLAYHDVLTDLPNRILLQDRLTQAIELARRQGRQLAVMFMDLDRFKYINDSLGHAIGDQLLQSVAQQLEVCVRQSDTISRQGGDEFVLLLPYIEHAEDAALSAQKMLTALALPHQIDQHDLHISVSIGISIYPDDGQDAETLIKSADTAMYYAKEKGRNNYQFFKQDMNDRAVERQSLEGSLRQALTRQEFVLHYQPKVNLETGAITGAEALIRWLHPIRGPLSPNQFVSIAEDSGLIVPIGQWILREACRQAQAWQNAGLGSTPIAVNISAVEFRREDFLADLRGILRDTGLDPHYLEIELTESVLVQDVESTMAVLHALKALGVQLAIDDFGTGYSSLSYLRQFPIDTLKIDQSFVRDIATVTGDATIVRAVIGMGNSLKLRVSAEGVETREQLAFLQAEHCEEGQGFYFSPPIDAEAFAELLGAGKHRIRRQMAGVL
jgi:diguanylate cyclase (GGDEF)-like protein